MDDTYIKLWRSLLKKPIMQNPKILQVWIWCLLKASHKEHEQAVGRQKVLLQPGQFVFGRFSAGDELKLPPTTIRDYLYWLRDNKSIAIKSANKYSLISVLNWEDYQGEDEKPATKSAKKSPPNGQQIATNKNVKNGNNISPYGDINRELSEAVDAFVEMRKSTKRKMTDRAISMMIKKLHGMATTDEEKIAILEQSTRNSWTDIYPLKIQVKQQPLSGREYLRQKVRGASGQPTSGEVIDVFGERIPETE